MTNIDIYVSGDIHANFPAFFDYLLDHFCNVLIIVAGDCGFGFLNENAYLDLFDAYDSEFTQKNITVFFVRGNHDDPEYFNTDIYDKVRSGFRSFRLLPDYAVINGSIMVVGGATSEDRATRELNVNYWSREEVTKLTTLPETVTPNVKYIISHEAPSISSIQRYPMPPDFPVTIETKMSMQADRDYLTSLFNVLHPKLWVHGHYHRTSREHVQGCEFICCPMFNPDDLNGYHLCKIT